MAERALRRRGGQPNNQNARKEGVYSRFLPASRAEEHQELTKVFGLYEEIALVRMFIRDLLVARAETEDVLTAIELLNRLISTNSRIWH